MPYKSDKQRRYMHWAAEHGKIEQSVVDKFDAEERAKNKKGKKFKKFHKYLTGEDDAES